MVGLILGAYFAERVTSSEHYTITTIEEARQSCRWKRHVRKDLSVVGGKLRSHGSSAAVALEANHKQTYRIIKKKNENPSLNYQ